MLYRAAILLLFIITLPLQIGIAVLVFVTSGLPILFIQRRIGKMGRLFDLYKFRTMEVDAEKKQRFLLSQNESSGPTFKIRMDPRFTYLGAFLSHTGLDEIPQFINVLRGDMSLIGPRPLPVAECRRLQPWMRKRECVKPGIISPAILQGDYHKDFTAWMKSDVAYARDKNMRSDLLLFARAVIFLLHAIYRELTYGMSRCV